MKIKARDVAKINGFLEFFIDGVGYEIKFVPEKVQKKLTLWTTPPP